jgi:hypothetical protein
MSVAHEGSNRDCLLLFIGSRDVDDLAISTALREDLEENLEPQDVLIVVRKNSFEGALRSLIDSLFMNQTLDRFRSGVRMSVVAFDDTGNETERSPVREDGENSEIPLDAIVRTGATRIFRTRNGFVESSPNYHFENPSGKHTNRFIRLSNTLSAQAEISFMAFCLLRSLPQDVDVVYTDTPSVFPLLAAFNEHRQLICPEKPYVGVENFSSYSVLESQESLPAERAAILISASSSGSLADKITARLGFPRTQIWHMLYAGPDVDDYQVVSNLNFDESLNPEGVRRASPAYIEGSCEYCNAGSFPIPLRGDQFELPGPQLDSIQLTRADEPPGLRATIGRYAGQAIFGVGMGPRQSDTARQYNVDVSALAANDEFMSSFDYVLRRSLPEAATYVIALDEPSMPFAMRALDALNQTRSGHARLLRRADVDSIVIGNNAPVVVVAAAVESGRSLLDLSRDLRSRCSDSPISYIIGVSKTNGSPRREELFNNLAMTNGRPKHEVIACELITLPSSSEGNAWHRERDVLARIKARGVADEALEAFVDKRLERLSDNSSIFDDDLFWANTPEVTLRVQPGFVFASGTRVGSYKQADVYFTISSALQRLRARAWASQTERAIRSNWFQQTLLSPENFGRFNDGAIQASLLRAASPRELNYCGDPDASGEAARIISRIVRTAAEPRGEAATEFLLALATKTLQLRPPDRDLVIAAADRSLPHVSLLAEYCEAADDARADPVLERIQSVTKST